MRLCVCGGGGWPYAGVVLMQLMYFDILSHRLHPNLIVHLMSFNLIQWILNRRWKETREGLRRTGLWYYKELRKNLTITTNCSHYCSHSPHQYCDSYWGVIRACHRHTNYFSNGCYYSSPWQPGLAAIVLNRVNCSCAVEHPGKVSAACVCDLWPVREQRPSDRRQHTD